MARQPIGDLAAFLAVARERSFTRAAAQLGVSPSALSQTMRVLEERLGVRLLTRTTRSVAPTEAGERLIATVGPHLDEIETGLAALSELRDRPAGTIRITTVDHAAETILWPALSNFLAKYPDIQVDLIVDNTLRDIVAERFDAGIRMGERLARDMIAVRIGPDIRLAAVATPSYFAEHGKPKTPQDLDKHRCINMRLATLGGVYVWGVRERQPRDQRQGRRATHRQRRRRHQASDAGKVLASPSFPKTRFSNTWLPAS